MRCAYSECLVSLTQTRPNACQFVFVSSTPNSMVVSRTTVVAIAARPELPVRLQSAPYYNSKPPIVFGLRQCTKGPCEIGHILWNVVLAHWGEELGVIKSPGSGLFRVIGLVHWDIAILETLCVCVLCIFVSSHITPQLSGCVIGFVYAYVKCVRACCYKNLCLELVTA